MSTKQSPDLVSILKRIGTLDNEDRSIGDLECTNSDYFDDASFISKLKNPEISLSILSMNICSLHAKFHELQVYLELLTRQNATPSLICLQEAFVSDNCDLSMYALPGYSLISSGKSASPNGGLVVYIHSSLSYEPVRLDHDNCIWEGLGLKIRLASKEKVLTLVNVYRPPRTNSNTMNNFFENFSKTLNDLNKRGGEIIVVGDFNIDLCKMDSRPLNNRFFETICALNLLPKITKPTRICSTSSTLIDNILCTASDLFPRIDSGILLHQFSDHKPVFALLRVRPFRPVVTTASYRRCSPKQMEDLKNDLKQNSIILDENEPSFTEFHTQFQARFNKFCPLSVQKSNKYNNGKNKWITPEILAKLKCRDKLYFRLRKLQNKGDRFEVLKLQLRNYNKVLRKLINRAKRTFFHTQFQLFKNDIKKTWAMINETMGRKRSGTFPDFIEVDGRQVRDSREMAEHFNTFFSSIGDKISNSIKDPGMDPLSTLAENPSTSTICQKELLPTTTKFQHDQTLIPTSSQLNHPFNFQLVHEESVRKAIDSLNPKSSFGFDGVSLKLLKFVRNEIAENLMIIINDCIIRNTFPDLMKLARVIPLFKKGEKTNIDNYRPVSLLSSFSKVFERILHDQLNAFFESNKLFNESQYGFRANRSTELAAAHILNLIRENKFKGRKTVTIFLDLSKAFDSINHQILLRKLPYYGFSAKSVNLVTSYLANRNQYVDINGNLSQFKPLPTGVPQGSILGPLLFNIYVNDLPLVSACFNFITYADDSTLVFSVPHRHNIAEINNIINREFSMVNDWFKANKLQLNAMKTNYMVFRGKRAQSLSLNIKVGDDNISEVDNFKFLGLWLSFDLSWSKHIDQVSIKISRATGAIRKLGSFFPCKILLFLYHSLVGSHLTFHILNWGETNEKAFKLQKRAIRAVHNAHYLAHTSPIFRSCGALKVQDLYRTALLKFYYKFLNRNLPLFFLNLPIKTNAMLQKVKRPTRNRDDLATPRAAPSSLEFRVCNYVNALPAVVRSPIGQSKMKPVVTRYKNFLLQDYELNCQQVNCYSCVKTKVTAQQNVP